MKSPSSRLACVQVLAQHPAGLEFLELPTITKGGIRPFNRRFNLAVSENDVSETKWDEGSVAFDPGAFYIGPLFIDNLHFLAILFFIFEHFTILKQIHSLGA